MSSVVPEGWEETNLSSLVSVDIESLKGNTDPDYKFKYIDISCVSTGSVTPPSQYILFQNAPSRAKRVVRQNDVLIATVRPNLKAFAHFDEEGEDWVASTGFAVLRNKEWADSRFIFNVMLSDDVSGQIDKLVAGSNYPAINSSDVKDLTVLSPPLPEQKKIASILTSVDEVIENTQKQIDKLQDLKKATMNELLTKGIGHTEFKDSELGRIPKSWDVLTFSESDIKVLDGDRGNEYPKEADFKSSGFCLFLSAKNVTKNGFRFDTTAFITKDKDERLRKGRLNPQDIVITTRGTVGNIAFYDDSVNFNTVRINSGMAIIRNNNAHIECAFIYKLLSSGVITTQLKNLTFGSAQPQLTIGTLNELQLPIPPLAEQSQIVSAITSIQIALDKMENKLSQTKSLKKSLMQDLLTGKVRVTVN
ncbi:restriction endonuclease subunit S [Gammaproteobacteria bacterium]|nr:restriction endonuclease subunit S [Gammaproteobacteria bacterium]